MLHVYWSYFIFKCKLSVPKRSTLAQALLDVNKTDMSIRIDMLEKTGEIDLKDPLRKMVQIIDEGKSIQILFLSPLDLQLEEKYVVSILLRQQAMQIYWDPSIWSCLQCYSCSPREAVVVLDDLQWVMTARLHFVEIVHFLVVWNPWFSIQSNNQDACQEWRTLLPRWSVCLIQGYTTFRGWLCFSLACQTAWLKAPHTYPTGTAIAFLSIYWAINTAAFFFSWCFHSWRPTCGEILLIHSRWEVIECILLCQ